MSAQAAIETIGVVSGVIGIVDFAQGLVPERPAEGTVVRIKAGLGSPLDDVGGWVRVGTSNTSYEQFPLTLVSGRPD